MTSPIPDMMGAVLLTGHGGAEMLQYRDDVAVQRPAPGEVLIRVAAAGVNNTDINTRIGWYAKAADGDAGEEVAVGPAPSTSPASRAPTAAGTSCRSAPACPTTGSASG